MGLVSYELGLDLLKLRTLLLNFCHHALQL